jgi:hypothetical protein
VFCCVVLCSVEFVPFSPHAELGALSETLMSAEVVGSSTTDTEVFIYTGEGGWKLLVMWSVF